MKIAILCSESFVSSSLLYRHCWRGPVKIRLKNRNMFEEQDCPKGQPIGTGPQVEKEKKQKIQSSSFTYYDYYNV